MPARPTPPRPAINDNDPPDRARKPRLARLRRRVALCFTFACLAGGAALGLASGHIDSVMVSHASRSAVIVGLVGLRRVAADSDAAIGADA